MPHEVVMKAIHREGVNFLMTRFDGNSLAMYVTNLLSLAEPIRPSSDPTYKTETAS